MTKEEITAKEQQIAEVLKTVYDPEIPVNIFDLGLIYEINYDPDGTAHIRMTLTAPNCPMADMLVEEVRSKTASVEGVERVDVELTFDPPWSRDLMSQEALLELGML